MDGGIHRDPGQVISLRNDHLLCMKNFTSPFLRHLDHTFHRKTFLFHSFSLTTSLVDFGQTRPSTSSNRLFPRSGMIPRYTGYLPRKFLFSSSKIIFQLIIEERKYRCGQTFGDTTRELPICSHPYSNYGDHLRSKSFIESSTTKFQ